MRTPLPTNAVMPRSILALYLCKPNRWVQPWFYDAPAGRDIDKGLKVTALDATHFGQGNIFIDGE